MLLIKVISYSTSNCWSVLLSLIDFYLEATASSSVDVSYSRFAFFITESSSPTGELDWVMPLLFLLFLSGVSVTLLQLFNFSDGILAFCSLFFLDFNSGKDFYEASYDRAFYLWLFYLMSNATCGFSLIAQIIFFLEDGFSESY